MLATSAKVPDALGWPIDPCFPVQIDPKAEQFEQVVACADQRPFAVHLLQSPQQELPESRPCLIWPNTGSTAIRDVGEDVVVAALTERLGEIHGQVEKEWNGESAAGAFATSLVEGMLQPESPEAIRQDVALLLSLQWDSDPARAIAWLESLGE